ncbi:pilus assembly PilX N-terminal domain-containing protein [Chitinolyticbacter meiyuanensis]|uniref:pilus assembly PilX N-terminal domain-containing protein n=1 Tax=Chitinolyticbacter meiyuanensis TaxID=682798 RepID=UPI0011E5FCB3|nr:agglutinin biogenesis protein MshP [Chitinolyticbacter meiyuanensis]
MSPTCRDAGFALISALFLLLVLSTMAAFTLTLSSSAQQGATLDVQGSRAYQAARAGIEYGAFQALQNGQCASSSQLTLPAPMADFSINLACSSSAHNIAGNTVTLYRLTATACNLPAGSGCPPATRTLNYVERQISATLSRCTEAGGGGCA